MKTYVYIAQSLDGFIAKIDGDLKWLEKLPNPNGEDFGFTEFMNKIDVLLMGTNTYEKVLSFGFWPYKKTVYVLSNRIKEVPIHLKDKVFIVNGTLDEVVKTLAEKGFESIYVDGGRVIQSFLKEDKVDNLTITTMPIILGDGITLFGKIEKELEWELLKTEVLNNYAIKTEYRRKK